MSDMGLPWTIPGGQQVQFTPYQIGSKYGGDAEVIGTGAIQSENYLASSDGWRIDGLGDVEFNDGNFRGDITGATGTFSGAVTASSIDIDADADPSTSFHVDKAGNVRSVARTSNTS